MRVFFKNLSDGNDTSFFLYMKWEHSFLKNTRWEEIQPSINNIGNNFKNQICFSDLFPDFHVFIFHPVLLLITNNCFVGLDCLVWGCQGSKWSFSHSKFSFRRATFQGQNMIQTLSGLLWCSFKHLQNIKGIYNLVFIISPIVNKLLFLKTLYRPSMTTEIDQYHHKTLKYFSLDLGHIFRNLMVKALQKEKRMQLFPVSNLY